MTVDCVIKPSEKPVSIRISHIAMVTGHNIVSSVIMSFVILAG